MWNCGLGRAIEVTSREGNMVESVEDDEEEEESLEVEDLPLHPGHGIRRGVWS